MMDVLDRAGKLIEDTLISDDQGAMIQQLQAVIKLLKDSEQQVENKSELFYMIAYCWYRLPIESKERDEQIELYLSESLAITEHQFARLYFAHYYFDKEAYLEAQSQFMKLDLEFFKGIDQEWRVLKIKELLLVCQLHLSSKYTITLVREYTRFVEEFLSTKEEDTVFPNELIEHSFNGLSNADHSDEIIVSIASELNSLIFDMEEEVTYAEEFALFKQISPFIGKR